jgi:polyphosphate kinase 2 (PPK2 family)
MVGVKLTDFEQATPFAGDHDAALADLQQRLAMLQLAQIVHGSRAIILFDGWEGSGRKAVLKLLAAALDPCHLSVHGGPALDQSGRHWLAHYWSLAPRSGETCVFFGSWYADAVRTRLAGDLADKDWARTSDELNEFEAQQTDHGAILVKLFFHVPGQVQSARLVARAADPWLQFTVGRDPAVAASTRSAAQPLWEQLVSRSNTRWAPWTIVDAGDEQAAAVSALSAIADAFRKKVPLEPPAADDKVVRLTGTQHR